MPENLNHDYIIKLASELQVGDIRSLNFDKNNKYYLAKNVTLNESNSRIEVSWLERGSNFSSAGTYHPNYKMFILDDGGVILHSITATCTDENLPEAYNFLQLLAESPVYVQGMFHAKATDLAINKLMGSKTFTSLTID